MIIKDISINKGTYTSTDTSIEWLIDTMDKDEVITLTITVQADNTDIIKNTASVERRRKVVYAYPHQGSR